MNFLRVALWNANGLANHYQEIKLSLIQHKIDVCLFSETHFTDRSHFKILEYIVYCTNQPDDRAHGQTAVIVHRKIRHQKLPNVQNNFLQATSVILECSNNSSLALSAVYPPSHIINKDQFMEFFTTLSPKFIAGRDYNAKHTYWRFLTPRDILFTEL